MTLLTEMSRKSTEYPVSSILSSSARKGMSVPMQVKGTDIIRKFAMYAERYALLDVILKEYYSTIVIKQ